jgi:hypothetical protein
VSLAIKIECRGGINCRRQAAVLAHPSTAPRYLIRLNTEIARNFLIGQAKIGQSGDRRRRIRAQNLARFSGA